MSTTFETRAQRRARKRLERKQAPPARSNSRWLWLSLLVIVIGAGAWWIISRPQPTAAEKTAKAKQAHVNLVKSCTTDMATTFHIHSHITIIINGEEQTIPADTGISSTCLHPIHTHDETGIIHMESPVKEDFTIADFFQVWGKALTPTKVLNTTVDAEHQLKLFSDGKEIATGAQTVMHDHQSLAIIVAPIGTTITPPANYQFPADLPSTQK